MFVRKNIRFAGGKNLFGILNQFEVGNDLAMWAEGRGKHKFVFRNGFLEYFGG